MHSSADTSPPPSVIARLRAGRDESGYETAVQFLWDKYFIRMLYLARKKLGSARSPARDEEDIAVSAFKSFCMGMQSGKYQHNHSPDLWPLLVSITINKAIDHFRRANRLKRGGGFEQVTNEIDQLVLRQESPEMQMIAAETLEQLFVALDNTADPNLRTLATLRLQDTPPAEMARQLACTIRTVQRKLKTIQAIWQSLEPPGT